MAETPRLKLPLLDAGQAQKHVTHNEALLQLDLLTGIIPVLDRSLATPPGASDGAVYILSGAGSGAWTGFSANDLALRVDGGWRRVLPSQGMLATIADEGGLQVYWSGSAWLTVGVTIGRRDKSAATARASTTVLADDPHLVVALSPLSRYRASFELFFDAPAAPGFKWALSGPASPASVRCEWRCRAPGATTLTLAGTTALVGSTAIAGNAAPNGHLLVEALIETGAAGGNLALQWAQNASSATNTTLAAGSSLEWRQL